MAVYAAHLTRTLNGTPSIFQVTAQEALGTTIKPALRKLIEYFAAVYPNKCGWCEKWYDELYLLFDFCLQYHYIKHYAASFSECFYGLLRMPITPCNEFHSGTRLPEVVERGSLALLVLVPYVKDKIEKTVEKWRVDNEDGLLGKSTADQTRKAAVKLYSIIHFVVESAKLVQLARYLTAGTPSPTIELALLGLTLKDAPPPQPEEYSWTDLFKSLRSGEIGSASLSFPLLGSGLLRAVQYGAFAVQLLRWWEARAPLTQALPVPAPLQKEVQANRWRNKCPICLQTWKVPTVLPVSGYVFCYGCISRHLRGCAACPVTALPASERSLVRLYLSA